MSVLRERAARALNFAAWTALAFACLLVLPAAAKAQPIKIGTLRVAAFAPLFIAQDKGYFAAEGVPADLTFFEAAQPVAVATVSGGVDFGVAAMTGGFYNLAGQGALKLIAAANR